MSNLIMEQKQRFLKGKLLRGFFFIYLFIYICIKFHVISFIIKLKEIVSHGIPIVLQLLDQSIVRYNKNIQI